MSFVILEAENENSGLDVRKQYTVEEKRADEIIILSQRSQKSELYLVPILSFLCFVVETATQAVSVTYTTCSHSNQFSK